MHSDIINSVFAFLGLILKLPQSVKLAQRCVGSHNGLCRYVSQRLYGT